MRRTRGSLSARTKYESLNLPVGMGAIWMLFVAFGRWWEMTDSRVSGLCLGMGVVLGLLGVVLRPSALGAVDGSGSAALCDPAADGWCGD